MTDAFEPHKFYPSFKHAGDCMTCGRVWDEAHHIGTPSREAAIKRQAIDDCRDAVKAYADKNRRSFLNVGAACDEIIVVLEALKHKETR